MEVQNYYGYAPKFDIKDLNPFDIPMDYINTHLKFGEYMDLVNWWKNNNS